MSKTTALRWLDLGAQMMAQRNYRGAIEAYAKAVKSDPKSAVARHDLAIANIGAGDYESAGVLLTEALRIRPDLPAIARRFDELADAGHLPASANFDSFGLKAALEFDTINRDDLCALAVEHLMRKPELRTALETSREENGRTAALNLCRDATGALLREDLLKKALATAFVTSPELEHLLTALRKVILLDLPLERMQDRSLVSFIIALAQQCQLNEHIWAISEAEETALSGLDFSMERAATGDAAEGLKLLIISLYKSIDDVIGATNIEALKQIRPTAVRDLLLDRHAVAVDLQARAQSFRGNSKITDPTSLSVANQYERNPFPRWTSVALSDNRAAFFETLRMPFGADKLAKLSSAPFEVLIAGCGTGLQAVKAAHYFGSNAKITAIDLSAASLAYAERMAEKFGAKNISFLQADILDIGTNPQFANRFDIIECIGVLHHMAEPLLGLASIKACLAPSGLMLIALYSEIARHEWTQLKSQPEYPGESCDDMALRSYRQSLLARMTAKSGPWSSKSRDLYTVSGFRDLFLHVMEHRHTLPQLKRILGDEKLVFRGFADPQDFNRLKKRFPDEAWPGNLDRWAAFEQENPHHFMQMYFFWCGHSGDYVLPG